MKLVLEERIEDVDVFDPETLVLYTPPFRFNPGGSCAGIPTRMNDTEHSSSHFEPFSFDPLVCTFYKDEGKEVFPIFEAPRIKNSRAEDLLKAYEEMQNKEPLRIYNLQGYQIHIHNDASAGNIQDINNPNERFTLNSYEAAIADLLAGKFDLPLIDTSCRKKRL
ncbi:MAG TPA: hypothetical protein HA294_00665 [Nanoarchaeota archaeon]|nr:hypothetical protein [Nanoarchaeota archaeon]